MGDKFHEEGTTQAASGVQSGTQGSITELLLEPVVESEEREWPPRGFPPLTGVTIHRHCITIKITHLSGPVPERITLSKVQINLPNTFQMTFDSIGITSLTKNGSASAEHLSAIFPTPGLYVISATVSAAFSGEQRVSLKVYQRQLDGRSKGRGWHYGGPENEWYNPLAVADRLALTQAELNASIKVLTNAILVLTVAALIVQVLYGR